MHNDLYSLRNCNLRKSHYFSPEIDQKYFFRTAQLIGRHCKLKGEIGSRSLVIATFFSQFTFRFIEWRIERTPHNFFCSLIFFFAVSNVLFYKYLLKKICTHL